MFETRLMPVALPKGGVAARVHVRAGDVVQAGDLIVTLDSAALDRQIAALKAQAKTATRQLALVRQEASGLVRPADAPSAYRPLLASLEQRTGELEQEAQWLLARIAAAEEELAQERGARTGVGPRGGALGAWAECPDRAGNHAGRDRHGRRTLLERLLMPVWRGLARYRAPTVQLAEPRG